MPGKQVCFVNSQGKFIVKNSKGFVFSLPVILWGWSVGAVAANNAATVIVENKTAQAAKYTYEYILGSVSPALSDVPAKESKEVRITSFTDTSSGMRFVYTAGSQACRFSTTLTVSVPSYVPTWKKDATSIGRTRATCSVSIEKIDMKMPYNYTVRFTIN